jgi:hypothetical protein
MIDNLNKEHNMSMVNFQVPRRRFIYNFLIGSPRYVFIWIISLFLVTFLGFSFDRLIATMIVNIVITYLIFWRLLNLTRHCLKEFEFSDGLIILTILRYDKELAPIRLEIEHTRIQIQNLIFPIFKNGNNFKLIITYLDKDLKKYKVIHTQHEIGYWDLDLFREILTTYGRLKKVTVNPNQYQRYGF